MRQVSESHLEIATGAQPEEETKEGAIEHLWGFGLRVEGLGFREFQVWGLGFGVYSLGGSRLGVEG